VQHAQFACHCDADGAARPPSLRSRCIRWPDAFRKSGLGPFDAPRAALPCSGLLQSGRRNPLQFNVANEVWSLGAVGTQVLFDSESTSAQVGAGCLLAKRRQLSSDRAHGLPTGGSATAGTRTCCRRKPSW
jgi:hypothetical protein